MADFWQCGVCQLRRPQTYCAHCSALIHQWKATIPKLADKVGDLKNKNTQLRQAIQEKLDKRRKKNETIVRKQLTLIKIQALKEKIQQLRQQNMEDAEKVEEARSHNEIMRKGIEDATAHFEKREALVFENYAVTLGAMKREESDLSEQVMMKRQELIRNLLSILPVSPIGESNCRIINVVLPNSGDYSAVTPRPYLYTALGYVVHLQVLISRYLDITLPFKLESRGTESIIYREEVRYTGREVPAYFNTRFPLYYRGNEREFRLGVDALNINLAYICFSQSISLTKQQIPQTLLNLRRLLSIPWLGRDASQAELFSMKNDGTIYKSANGAKDLSIHDWEMI